MVQEFVNAVPEFTQHPAVINGASDSPCGNLRRGDLKSRPRCRWRWLTPFNVTVEVAAVLEVG
jgi:hypothetical protein